MLEEKHYLLPGSRPGTLVCTNVGMDVVEIVIKLAVKAIVVDPDHVVQLRLCQEYELRGEKVVLHAPYKPIIQTNTKCLCYCCACNVPWCDAPPVLACRKSAMPEGCTRDGGILQPEFVINLLALLLSFSPCILLGQALARTAGSRSMTVRKPASREMRGLQPKSREALPMSA